MILPKDNVEALEYIAEYLLGDLRHEDTESDQQETLRIIGERLSKISVEIREGHDRH